MGFYIRKAIRVGPLRFNLSKSGIGVSAGVKGLRIGTGPRGNYIHMGRGGLYYRKTLPSSSSSASTPRSHQRTRVTPNPLEDTHDPLAEIESADISAMVDSSSRELVEELNLKRKKIRLWPLSAIAGLISLGMLASNQVATWVVYTTATGFILLTSWLAYRDILAKSVVMLYDIEDRFEKAFQLLHDASQEMKQCIAAWHLEASGRVKNKKYHAGADALVQRSSVSLTFKNPPFVKTNVATLRIPVGRQTLYFFPDRVLVFEPNGVGAVSYENLRVDVSASKFIESGSVPSDAEIVDHTWQYVNKRGGPDKRFKGNRRIPVAMYEEVHFKSDTGLNERIQLSRHGIGKSFAEAVMKVANAAKTYV